MKDRNENEISIQQDRLDDTSRDRELWRPKRRPMLEATIASIYLSVYYDLLVMNIIIKLYTFSNIICINYIVKLKAILLNSIFSQQTCLHYMNEM